MSKPTEWETVNAMTLYGGSFVEQLAKLYNCADNSNQLRIRAAFPELWSQYEELASMQKKKQRGECP
jgi:hypothetical protein